MVRLLSFGIGVISTVMALVPVMVILRYLFFKKHTKIQFLLIFIYAVYLSAAFTIVGIPALNEIMIDGEFNLIPFIDILDSPREYVINEVLNVILFVPLGFLVPAIWDEYRSIKKSFMIGIGLSFIIEILQIFTFRITDIDDLITNTLGAVIGYSLSRKLPEDFRLKFSVSNAKYEPLIVCGIVLVLIISIRPLISGAIWNFVFDSPLWQKIRG